MKIKFSISLVVSAILLLCARNSINAQSDNGYITVRIINVHADTDSDWIDLQRRSKEALEKIGGPGRSVWQEVRGDNYVFHIVEDHDNWAHFDKPVERGMESRELALWGRDIRKATHARHNITYRSFDDLEIEPPEGSTPQLLALRKITVKPGQAGAFQTWLREKLVPAIRKSGATGRSFGQVVMGGDLNQFFIAIHHDSWASLDEPSWMSKLSDSERDEVFDGFYDMIVESTMVMLNYRADLSYKGPDE